jgi:hypothetical protein
MRITDPKKYITLAAVPVVRLGGVKRKNPVEMTGVFALRERFEN